MPDSAPSLASRLDQITGCEFNAQLISLWLSRFKKPGTRRAYLKDIGEFIDFLGDRPLHELAFFEIQEFEEHLASRRLAPRTCNRKLAAVRSLLTFGCERVRLLPRNVGAILESRPVKSDLAQRILTEEQVFQMLTLEPSHRNQVLLQLLYYTGLRVSEVCALTWKDVAERGEGEGQVTVFGKGGKTRVVMIPRQCWLPLLELRGDRGLGAPLFASAKGGGHLDTSQVYRIVRDAAKRAGIEGNVSPHWLRHCHASHALDRGAPLHVVQQTLGHSSPATTGRYLHARPGDSSGRYLG